MKLGKCLLIFFVISLYLAPVVGADYTDPYLEISKGNIPGHWKIHKFGHNEGLSTNQKQSGVVQIYTRTQLLQLR